MNEPDRSIGTEPLRSSADPIGPTLRDFWAWAFSDLLGNTLRGVLAEFVVGTALGCIADDDTRLEWDAYDLKMNGEIRIEVKSTAYFQSWGESKPRSLSFDIKEATGWDASTNTSGTERKRNSDVYVFCVLRAKDRADTIDVTNWEFYVASTATLNSVFEKQKSVGLASLKATAEVEKCNYEGLRVAVTNAVGGTSS